MNYIGSKQKLLPFLVEHITQTVPCLEKKTFAEIFAGTGVVARYFKQFCAEVIVNDLEPYSYVLLKNYLGNSTFFAYQQLLETLNTLEPIPAFIFKQYCLGGGMGRQYFSDLNGQKIDAIRLQIEQWKNSGAITENQFFFLLASLLESADKVANTASVYGAFLKHLKKTAQKTLHIQAALFEEGNAKTSVFQQDANQLITQIKGDILYLDPPYNARHYGANYHLLNTIALYDEFEPKGKTGLRHYPKSHYCQKNLVAEAFEDLISRANFEYIFLSYNNEGLLSAQKIGEILKSYGKYSQISKTYTRFKADKTTNRQHKADKTTEYLHILRK